MSLGMSFESTQSYSFLCILLVAPAAMPVTCSHASPPQWTHRNPSFCKQATVTEHQQSACSVIPNTSHGPQSTSHGPLLTSNMQIPHLPDTASSSVTLQKLLSTVNNNLLVTEDTNLRPKFQTTHLTSSPRTPNSFSI